MKRTNNYRQKIETYLGRKLHSSEIIHHKDGNSYNNNLKNLEILPSQKEHIKLHKKLKTVYKLDYAKILLELNYSTTENFKSALNTLFTPYQITIIQRRLQHLSLSKQDAEIFSRIIKKKLIAIANNKLHEICQNILK
jgi:hypothetical protein